MEDFLPQLLKTIENNFGRTGLVMTNVLLILLYGTVFLGALWFIIDFGRRIVSWAAGWAIPLGQALGVPKLAGRLAAIPFRGRVANLVRPVRVEDATVAVAFGVNLWILGTSYPSASLPISYPIVAGIFSTTIVLIAVRQLRANLGLPNASPLITVFYDDEDPACRRPDTSTNGEYTEIVYRVGVKGPLGKPLQGVIVELADILPRYPDLPHTLHPMGVARGATGASQWEGDGSFDLRPGHTQYIDVLRIRWRTDSNPKEGVVTIIGQRTAVAIERISHRLTIKAYGYEGPSRTHQFQFDFNGSMRFYAVEDAIGST